MILRNKKKLGVYEEPVISTTGSNSWELPTSRRGFKPQILTHGLRLLHQGEKPLMHAQVIAATTPEAVKLVGIKWGQIARFMGEIWEMS